MNIDVAPPIVKSSEGENADNGATNARSWKFFVDEINSIWRKRASDYRAIGQHLIEAKDELQRDAYNAMLKRLHFHPSVAKKLICIARNSTLSSHVHQCPPNWSTLYELSKLSAEILEAAFANGTIHPGMQRKDAIALKPKKEIDNGEDRDNEDNASPSTNDLADLSAAWESALKDQRRAFLDKLGRDGLCEAMSNELKTEIRDHAIGIVIAGASKSSSWAINATDKLHSAMRIAEQQERDDESVGRMIGALCCIAGTAERRGIARSDIVIAQGKSTKSRK